MKIIPPALERFKTLHKNYDLNLCTIEEQREKYFSEYHATGMPVVYIIAPTEVTEGRLEPEKATKFDIILYLIEV